MGALDRLADQHGLAGKAEVARVGGDLRGDGDRSECARARANAFELGRPVQHRLRRLVRRMRCSQLGVSSLGSERLLRLRRRGSEQWR